MPETSSERSSKRVLEPIDRVSEVLFGLTEDLTLAGIRDSQGLGGSTDSKPPRWVT